jgi:Protein of unknown function (DUF1778)
LAADRHRLPADRHRDRVSRVPLVPTTIRFAPEAMELIERAAQQMGTSVAQFVREAAIVRAMVVENHPETEHLADALLGAHEGSTVQQLARRRP